MDRRSEPRSCLGVVNRSSREEHIALLRLLSRQQRKADPLPAGGAICARGDIPGTAHLLLRYRELRAGQKLRTPIDRANSDEFWPIGAMQPRTVHQVPANTGIAGF